MYSIIEAAEIIKETVSADELVRVYGYQPDRAGYIPCPFHAEKTGSCRIYNRPGKGWHCYGCGKGGSVIDFVIQHDGATFRQAVLAINNALDLHLDIGERKDEIGLSSSDALVKAQIDHFADALIEIIEGYRKMIEGDAIAFTRRCQQFESIPKKQRTVDDTFMIEHLNASIQDCDQRLEEIKNLCEEVKQWARKMKKEQTS